MQSTSSNAECLALSPCDTEIGLSPPLWRTTPASSFDSKVYSSCDPFGLTFRARATQRQEDQSRLAPSRARTFLRARLKQGKSNSTGKALHQGQRLLATNNELYSTQ